MKTKRAKYYYNLKKNYYQIFKIDIYMNIKKTNISYEMT